MIPVLDLRPYLDAGIACRRTCQRSGNPPLHSPITYAAHNAARQHDVA